MAIERGRFCGHGGCQAPKGSPREEQHRRNAAARRNLETLRDRKLWQLYTKDVWDTHDRRHYT